MRCIHCNSEVAEGNQFCPYCGNPMSFQHQSQQGQYQQPQYGQYQQPHAGGYNNGGNSYNNSYNAPNNYGRYNMGGGPSYSSGKPDNNLVWAILTTVLCCLPIGVYSIILASKVNGLYESGNIDEAQRTADEAKKWAIIGAVAGLVINFIGLIFFFLFE